MVDHAEVSLLIMAHAAPSPVGSQAEEVSEAAAAREDAGPRAPKTRHKIVTLCRLEYMDYSPKNCAPHLKLPVNPQLYKEYGERMEPFWRSCGFIARLKGQAELPETHHWDSVDGPLHHWQIYWEDERPDPSLQDIYELLHCKPWQVHVESCSNPIAAARYCSRANKRLPGTSLISIGTLPPEGRFDNERNFPRSNQGGARPGAGRPPSAAESAADKRKRNMEWSAKVLELARSGITYQQVIETPEILAEIQPSMGLARLLYELNDTPDYRLRPDRKVHAFWIHGPSRCGKSFEPAAWCERHNIPFVRLKPIKGMFFQWWSRLKGNERAVVCEDFDGQCWFRDLITLMDPCDSIGDVKGRDAVLRLKYFFFTSPKHPRDAEFYFDSSMKRRKMKDPVEEIAHLLNRFDHGGIYMWTRFPERPCICYQERDINLRIRKMELILAGQEGCESLRMKTCIEWNAAHGADCSMAAAFGYAPCNPRPIDEPEFWAGDPVHQMHQPHIPAPHEIDCPPLRYFGPKTQKAALEEDLDHLIKGFLAQPDDEGRLLWSPPPPPAPPSGLEDVD